MKGHVLAEAQLMGTYQKEVAAAGVARSGVDDPDHPPPWGDRSSGISRTLA